eukprot:6457858-Amphidinium_carterae.1
MRERRQALNPLSWTCGRPPLNESTGGFGAPPLSGTSLFKMRTAMLSATAKVQLQVWSPALLGCSLSSLSMSAWHAGTLSDSIRH